MTPLFRVRLLFDTVRYLRPVQIFGRVWFRTYRPRPDTSPAPGLRPPLNTWIPGPSRERITGDCCHFRFLNVEGELSGPEGWNDPAREKLWLYNLHYFDYLRPGAMDGAPEQAQSAIIGRWSDENPPAGGNGWEPYPLSLRIVNWIKWQLSGNVLDVEAIHSLAIQVRYLAKRLEWHLLGNHLFANAKALVFAGVFFEGEEADNWLDQGLRILEEQVPEQVLGDGGHFELSPMYHGIILEDLLDLVNMAGVCGARGNERQEEFTTPHPNPSPLGRGTFKSGEDFSRAVSAWIDAAQSMRGWLGVMCHPDGEIAFFNDAAFGIAPKPTALDDYARRLGLGEIPERGGSVVALRDSGYVRLARGPVVALLDVGRIGPDYLPGHGHADSLGFELSVNAQRVIVNSGISCYGVSDERHRQRSTAAHNTFEIDRENSSEVWGGFRVARRAKPHGLEIHDDDDRVRVTCTHDGYRRLTGRPVHRRIWTLSDRECCVRDVVEGRFRRAVGRLHFHPDVEVTITDHGKTGEISLPDGMILTFGLTSATGRIVPSTWHPEFGKSVPNECLEYEFNGPDAEFIMQWI